MKADTSVLGRFIYSRSSGSWLFFLPERIEGNEIYGYSIYIPAVEDKDASIAAREPIPEEGDMVFFESIPKVSRLTGFRKVTSKEMRFLVKLKNPPPSAVVMS
jgi:hypothetical protein